MNLVRSLRGSSDNGNMNTDHVLTLSDQENATLIIWGIFGDGSKVDLTRSSQMVYTSDRPSVAAVSSDGAVTGAGSGKAKITAKFGDKAIVIPIAVTAAK